MAQSTMAAVAQGQRKPGHIFVRLPAAGQCAVMTQPMHAWQHCAAMYSQLHRSMQVSDSVRCAANRHTCVTLTVTLTLTDKQVPRTARGPADPRHHRPEHLAPDQLCAVAADGLQDQQNLRTVSAGHCRQLAGRSRSAEAVL